MVGKKAPCTVCKDAQEPKIDSTSPNPEIYIDLACSQGAVVTTFGFWASVFPIRRELVTFHR